MISTGFRRITGVVLGVALIAGCDLSGLESASDDFDLIIELQEINTTVAAQVLDHETLEPIRGAELAFSGQDAGTIIDVYSDPITEISASEGVVTFGIENAVLPTESSPVAFGTTAQADGYRTETIDVALADSGGNNITLRLISDEVRTSVEGTAGVESTQAQTTAETGVEETVTIQTPQENNVQATTSATVNQGTKPLGADGSPLSGQISTQLQVFDLDQGLDAVPSQLKSNEEESLLGVAAFGMSDANGTLAFDFEAGGNGKVQECAFTMTNEVENEELYTAIEAGLLDEASIIVSSLDAAENIEIGTIPFQLGASPTVIATICIGGTNANVDMSEVREAASAHGKVGGANWHGRSRYWWSWRWSPPQSTLQTVVVDNSSNTAPQTINWVRIMGLGVNQTRTVGFTVPAGQSTTISFNRRLPTGRGGRVMVELSSGQLISESFAVPGGVFSRTVQLPTIEAELYTVTASLSCPSGQKLSPQVTRNSFSGLSLSSRPAGAKVQFADMGKAQNIEVSDGSVSATATATLVPGMPYEFRAMYGSSVEIRQATAPTGSNVVSFEVNPSDISGISCE